MEAYSKLELMRGVGPQTAKHFQSVGIETIHDLLHYTPRTYLDYSHIESIAHIKPGVVTIRAVVTQATGRYVRRGMHITEAVASDETGSVRLIWFNQPYRAAAIKKGEAYFITGKLELRRQRFAIQNPSMELVSTMPIHTARIVPVYPERKGIKTTLIRKLMATALQSTQINELLPTELIKAHGLLSHAEALKQLHFPQGAPQLALAQRTMAFIEVFELMLGSQLLKAEIASEVAEPIIFDENFAKSFVSKLPFNLTDAQRKAAWQVLQDMQAAHPMNRLLEGDVGSGKTVVAAMAAAMAMRAGYQAALLAPTELLARQHAEGISDLLKPLKLADKVSLLVGSQTGSQKTRGRAAIAAGHVGLMVGTHALLQDQVRPQKLGLLIIDEQHRFGVEQRKTLLKSTGAMPHVLSMTATPIPRSLALTLYGELDISLLDAMPPGRKPIITKIVSPNSREPMHEHIREELAKGHQIYVVCPLIKDGLVATVSAEEMHKKLTSVFKGTKVGLLHGKLKSADKNKVMENYVKGEIGILVATTVIEVGVNVPNATIMVIEGADRFGLAQLHQLRGRVGRSSDQGYCYIVPSDSKAPSQRLRALVQSTDGFKLAEMDLELRGPGAIYGTLQHGALDLRFAKLTDSKLLHEVRGAVKAFLQDNLSLDTYPELQKRVRLAQAVLALN